MVAQPCVTHAQAKLSNIGLFWIGAKPSPYVVPLTQGLRDHGYVPGRNIRIDDRFIVKGYEDLPEAARKLVSEKPDIIVVYGATAAQALQKATTTIPVVIAASSDPVKLGLVQTLSRPDTNFTGITNLSSDFSTKRLELLKLGFPSVRRVAVVLYPGSQAEILGLRDLEAAAHKMKMETRSIEIRTASEIGSAIATISKLDVQAIIFIGSSLFRAHAVEVVAETAKIRLPAMYPDELYVDAGGLFSYGPTVADNFRQAASHIDRILRGAKPADLPVEQPKLIRFTINAKTAKSQGITFPPSVLLRADRVVD